MIGAEAEARLCSFEDIAYKHDWFMHKPTAAKVGCKCVAPNFDDSARDIGKLVHHTLLARRLMRSMITPSTRQRWMVQLLATMACAGCSLA